MNHPSGHPGPDPRGDAAVSRVNAIRAARGLPPIVERDPAEVRREAIADRDAMMVAVAALNRPGCGATVPDAIDAALDGKPPAMAFDVPPAAAYAIVKRVPARHAPGVFAALDDELGRFAERVADAPHDVRALAHLAIDRMVCAVRPAIAASIAAEERGDGPTADFAAGFLYADLLERLRDDLLTVAGLP